MKTVDAKITRQGQVTIPVEIRRHLGLERGEHVTFVIADDGSVRIEPVGSTLESVAGSFVPLHAMSDDFDPEIDDAWSDEADRRMRSWRSE
jgi:antitoxin PrlF